MSRALSDARHRSTPHRVLPPRVELAVATAGPAAGLIAACAATVAVQATSPVAQRIPTGAGRFDLAAGWIVTQPGALVGSTSWFTTPVLGRLQLGGLVRLLGGAQAQSVLAAAHGAMLLLAVGLTALTWWTLRRWGAGPVVAGVAATVTGVAPEAVAVHAAPSAAAFAALWGLVAALLVGRASRVTATLSGVAAALAVASHPVAAIPLAVAVAVLVRDRRRGAPGPVPWWAVGGLGATAALIVLVGAVSAARTPTPTARALDAVGAAQGGPAPGLAAIAGWAATDPVLLVAVLVSLVVAARDRRSRSVAAAGALLLVASVWPLGTDAAAPVVVLLPVAALAIVATFERALAAVADPVLVRSVVGSGWLTGIAAVLLVSVVVWLSGIGGLAPGSAQPAAQAERWLRASVPADQAVLVGLGLWPDLAGPHRGWYAVGPEGAASSLAWTQVDYLLADRSLASASGAAGAAVARSRPVARFGAGEEELTVRAMPSGAPSGGSTPTPTPSTAAQIRAASARQEAGEQLAANPRITVDAGDRELLTSGGVDARIAIVLAQFATAHTVTVAGFAAEADDASGVRTVVVVSEVDGRRVPADAARTGDLLRFLSALRGDYRPRSIDAGAAGVTAAFAPDPEFVPAP